MVNDDAAHNLASADPNDPWVRELCQNARYCFDAWELANLPKYLQRNSLDYYYLSVWPGLMQLDDARHSPLPPLPPRTESAYFHIPFCSGRCSFCSYFLTVVGKLDSERTNQYVTQLVNELAIHAERTELALSYVYFGGGTPTLLSVYDMDRLLCALAVHGNVSPPLLGTVEAHPEFFDDPSKAAAFLDMLDSHGIRRISIGFQADDEGLLTAANRRHKSAFLQEAIGVLRERNFVINVDLMYGLPNQTLESWLRSLAIVLTHRPDSISTYCTFVDFGTRLWHDVHTNKVALPSHRTLQTQHIAAQLVLEAAGYHELPNDFYSLPTVPVSSYKQESLPSSANSLAVGAGSYGHYEGVQYYNEFDFARYTESIGARRAPIWRAAVLSDDEQMRRDIMFSFKNAPHVNGELFRARYGMTPWDAFPGIFAELSTLALVAVGDEACTLTPRGRLVVEEIACMFATQRSTGAVGPTERKKIRMYNFAPTYHGRPQDRQ